MAADVTARYRALEQLRESEAFMLGCSPRLATVSKSSISMPLLAFMSEGGKRVMEVSDSRQT